MRRKIDIKKCRWSLYINYERKQIYIPIPKNCSNSFRRVFKHDMEFLECSLVSGEKHVVRKNYYDCLKENPEVKNYYLFTIFRNPLDRFMSFFCFLFTRRRIFDENTIENDPRTKDLLDKSIEAQLLYVINTLEESGWFDIHSISQSYCLTDKEDNLFPFDFVFLMDDMKNDFLRFQKIFNYKKGLGHNNPNKFLKKLAEVRDVLTDQSLLERIKLIYKEDFALYETILNNRKKNIFSIGG
jgi:hypothetical protein